MPNTRKYWEEKAAEVRAEAGRMSIEANRKLLLDIARSYEQLAERAEEEQSNKGDGDER